MEAETSEVTMGEHRAMANEDEKYRKFYIPIPKVLYTPSIKRGMKLGGETEKR